MTILNKDKCSMYPKNTFPAHTAFLSDSLFGGNLKLQLTSHYLLQTMEQCYPSVRSSYSCIPQQLWLMTSRRQKIVV